MLRKILVICCAVLSLAGCAKDTELWTKTGMVAAQREQDIRECEYDAAKATASSGTTGLAGGISDGLTQLSLRRQCLEVRGYRQAS